MPLAKTNILDEHVASIFRMEIVREFVTALTVTNSLLSFLKIPARCYIPEDGILQRQPFFNTPSNVRRTMETCSCSSVIKRTEMKQKFGIMSNSWLSDRRQASNELFSLARIQYVVIVRNTNYVQQHRQSRSSSHRPCFVFCSLGFKSQSRHQRLLSVLRTNTAICCKFKQAVFTVLYPLTILPHELNRLS
jgi:hypothetical protein